ncbi:hypothetical protein Droror1_Dr00016163, partial [Drosera rotundifolia]
MRGVEWRTDDGREVAQRRLAAGWAGAVGSSLVRLREVWEAGEGKGKGRVRRDGWWRLGWRYGRGGRRGLAEGVGKKNGFGVAMAWGEGERGGWAGSRCRWQEAWRRPRQWVWMGVLVVVGEESWVRVGGD